MKGKNAKKPTNSKSIVKYWKKKCFINTYKYYISHKFFNRWKKVTHAEKQGFF